MTVPTASDAVKTTISTIVTVSDGRPYPDTLSSIFLNKADIGKMSERGYFRVSS